MSLVRHSHADHPSWFNCCAGGCGSFYAITIASTAFKGIPMVKQHRLVNEALKKEIEDIHGLQVRMVFYYSDHMLITCAA